METMGVTPTMPLYSSNNDGMGMGGYWLWIILILLFFGGRGFGYGNGENAVLNDEFIKRDIFNTNTNVSNQGCATQKEVIDSRYTTQLGLQSLQASQDSCCCATQRAIDSAKAEAYKNTCEILTAIHNDGEATRALINAQAMQELRDRLADRDRELMAANFQISQQTQSQNLVNQLRPTPTPAYLTCSPYFAYNTGCGGCGNI